MSSPYINHFLQPDTLIPDPSNPQAWNRYSYVNNNPINSVDPSGHAGCKSGKRCLNPKVTASGATKKMPSYGNSLGDGVDERGVYFAMKHVSYRNAIVAAGIAVQSQWYNEVWDNPNNPAASSYGLAQATKNEFGDKDPMDPEVAVEIMTERIDGAVSLCIKRNLCQDDTDNFVVAALAQNGVSPNGWLDVRSLSRSSDQSANWELEMQLGGNTGNPLAKYRQTKSGMNFSTQFMLNLFTNDVKALVDQGYRLPEQYDEVNWATIADLLSVK